MFNSSQTSLYIPLRALMAVDLVSFQKMERHIGIHESAGSAEMKTIEEQLLRILQSHHQQIQFDCKDLTVPDSKQAVNRTGHARFRRGPSDPSTSTSQSEPVKRVQVKANPSESKSLSEECKSTNTPMSSGSSSITGEEGTVSNGKQGLLTTVVTPAPRTFSSGKPPLPSSHRKRFRDLEPSHGISGKQSISRGCHCCKRRKVVKREIQRVTTKGLSSSSKVGADDIPADEYSWKKYDQKLIPGTLFPRGYYKCNSIKGCPARKKVEKAYNDPTVLIVTYEGEHRHHHSHSHRWMKPEMTLTRLNGVGMLVESK